MVGLKSVKLNKAFVLSYPSMESDYNPGYLSLYINDTVEDVIIRVDDVNSVIISELGKYACTNPLFRTESNNIFGIDMSAVTAVSRILREDAYKGDLFLGGWHMFYKGEGLYWVKCTTYYGYDTGIYRNMNNDCFEALFDSTSGVFKSIMSCSMTGEVVRDLERWLGKVVSSLQSVGEPISLFEVCMTGTYDRGFGRYVPGYNVEAQVSNGVSVICKDNGFVEYPWLDGQLAMLVVQR